MADSSAGKSVGNGSTPGAYKLAPSLSFSKQISLFDWWLTMNVTPSKGRRLGVGGLSSKEQLGIRGFHSAEIVKRHNTNTVETVDGFIITVTGSINKPRTVLNGLPTEVCNHFLFGFPYYWEEFASQSFAEESTNRALAQKLSNFSGCGVSSADGSNSFLPKSFDDIPGVLLRDLFVSTLEVHGSCKVGKSFFEDALQTYRGDAHKNEEQSTSPNEEIDVMPSESGKSSKVQQKHKGEDDVADAKSRKVKFQKTSSERGTPTYANDLSCGPFTRSMSRSYANDLSSRPSTRSMSRLKTAREKHETNTLLSSLEKCQLIKSGSLSEASGKKNGGSSTGSNVSAVSLITRKLALRNRSIDLHIQGIS